MSPSTGPCYRYTPRATPTARGGQFGTRNRTPHAAQHHVGATRQLPDTYHTRRVAALTASTRTDLTAGREGTFIFARHPVHYGGHHGPGSYVMLQRHPVGIPYRQAQKPT